jgi:DNA-binding NarL/FixJ family response regulator
VTRLSQSDLEATLGFLGEAAAVTDPDPFPSELLDRLRDLVPCEWVSYEVLDPPGKRSVAYETCSRGREADASVGQPDEEFMRTVWRLMEEHPVCAYMARTGDLTAHKISDFATLRRWHQLGIYTEYFRPYGVEYRLVVGLPAPPPHKKTLLFDRGGDRDFGERDRVLLNRLQPHLSALDAAARERRLAAALREQKRPGLVVLQSSDQIDFATPAAARLLARFFGATSDGRLPEAIRAWLRRDAVRLNGNGLPPPSTAPLSVERGDRRLTIRRAGRTLILDEQIATLTSREREIVDHLAEGCSNAAIAERLTIAPTTVRTHLENIYAKLGVRNRTAAVAATRLPVRLIDEEN